MFHDDVNRMLREQQEYLLKYFDPKEFGKIVRKMHPQPTREELIHRFLQGIYGMGYAAGKQDTRNEIRKALGLGDEG